MMGGGGVFLVGVSVAGSVRRGQGECMWGKENARGGARGGRGVSVGGVSARGSVREGKCPRGKRGCPWWGVCVWGGLRRGRLSVGDGGVSVGGSVRVCVWGGGGGSGGKLPWRQQKQD